MHNLISLKLFHSCSLLLLHRDKPIWRIYGLSFLTIVLILYEKKIPHKIPVGNEIHVGIVWVFLGNERLSNIYGKHMGNLGENLWANFSRMGNLWENFPIYCKILWEVFSLWETLHLQENSTLA